MKAFKTLLILILLSNSLLGQQLNKLGHPFIRNYKPEEYGATEQNWAIVQDNRGVMYFGNTDMGVLEFDGKSWRSIPVSNGSLVRSLAKDEKGTIYVGAVAEIGYLTPDLKGNLEYVSLTGLIKDSIKQFSDIYKTYCFNHKVYFCSRQYIFIYNGNSIKTIDLGDQTINANFLTFIVNDHIYVGSYWKGLREVKNDSIITIAPNGDSFRENDIYSILPVTDQEVLLITKGGSTKGGKYKGGVFIYNQHSGLIKQIVPKNSYLSKLLNETVPYNGLNLGNNEIGIASIVTDDRTFSRLDLNGTLIELLNPATGLNDSWATFPFKNGDNPLWLALSLGISKVEIQSALRRFGEESGINGSINDVVRFNNTLYIATSNGVVYLNFDLDGLPKLLPINEINTTVWNFLVYKIPNSNKEILLAGGQPNIYEIKGTKGIPIVFPNQITHTCFKLRQSIHNPKLVYIGMASGLAALQFDNGSWVNKGYIKRNELRDEIRGIGEDNEGNIWLSTYIKGLIKLSFNQKDTLIQRVTSIERLKDLKNIDVIRLNDSLFFTTSQGLMSYNEHAKKFEFVDPLGLKKNETSFGISKIVKTPKGYAIQLYKDVGYNWVELVERDSLGNLTITKKPFQRLPHKWSDALWVDPDGVVWTGIAKELFSYNPKTKRNYDEPFNALIRKVTSKEDTVLFYGTFYSMNEEGKLYPSLTQQPEQILKLPYRFNRLVFEFGSTFYEWEEETTFSYFLEGGADETWSIWNKEAKATYTNLREGNYTFKVKAKNIYGTESSVAEYKFSIAPPWFRTILAYIIYGILFIAFVWILVRWNTRRLIAEKERLEQIVKERTAEVVRQKSEIELQRDKIVHQNEEIKSSIQYASRIQNALLTPPDQITAIFPNHFMLYLPRDIVSGDFFWVTQVGNKKIAVVADCTGHGVPGGFMSMLGMSFISQIIGKGGELHPADILNQLRNSVIVSLHQTGEVGGSKDGMDIAIFTFDDTTSILEYAGANNPLILIRDNEVQHIKGDKMPIGIHIRAEEPFTNNVIEIKPGDRVYTFSDGYADQFGGPDQRKFMIKNLKELLLEIHQKPMPEQRDILDQTLLNWHGSSPRIDDVVVMGVQF